MADDAEDLIQDHLAGTLDGSRLQRLEAWLQADPAHRERFVRTCGFHADLRRLATDRVATSGEVAGHHPLPVQPRPMPRRIRWSWLAVAASLLLLLGGWWFTAGRGREDVQLMAGSVRSGDGAVLHAGQVVAGRELMVATDAVLRWRDGSEVSCIAGSRITVREGGVDLPAGVCSAAITHRPADRPFTIQGSHAQVVVVGTRFTVMSDVQGTTVAVAEGRVRVRDGLGCERLMEPQQTVDAGVAGFAPRTVLVSPGGPSMPGAVPTLRQALAEARPGDVVVLLPGIHLLEREVVLRSGGRPDAPLTIRALPGARLMCGDWNGLHLLGVAWVRIAGLRFSFMPSARNEAAGNAIRIENGHHLTVMDCVFDAFGGEAVACGGSDHITISGNCITGCGGGSRWGQGGISINGPVAVDTAPGPHLTISGNRIVGTITTHRNEHGNGWTGGNAIGLFDVRPGDPFPHRTLVAGNQLVGNAGSAVLVSGLQHVDVEDNICHRNGRLADHVGAEVVVNAEDCRLQRNLLVPSPGRVPWLLQGRHGALRTGNRVWGPGAEPGEMLEASPYAQPVEAEDRRAEFTLRPDAGRRL